MVDCRHTPILPTRSGFIHGVDWFMNLILEKSERIKFYTNLEEIFAALGERCSKYDWYISDIELNTGSLKEGWYSGSELEDFLEKNKVQFIWAVLSAVPLGQRPQITNVPYVDNNPYYWNGSEIKPQLHGALFEIACWDSSATILVGLNDQQLAHFIDNYPEAVELKSAAR